MEIVESEQRESMKLLNDYFRDNHLVLNQEPWDESKRSNCHVCEDPLSGETYSSTKHGSHHFHKRCAEAPSKINHTFGKHRRRLFTFGFGPSPFRYKCEVCLDGLDGYAYGCTSYSKYVHFKCTFVTHNQGDEIKLDIHKHPLILIENYKNHFIYRNYCSFCEKPLLGSIYVCPTCFFFFHKKCVEFPGEVRDHPYYYSHSLFLNPNDQRLKYSCELCNHEISHYFYSCSCCNLRFHLGCLLPSPIIEDKSQHPHPFNLLWKRDPFVCNACGDKGNVVSYVCLTCHLQVHKDCISLPRLILSEARRHLHILSHNYLLGKMEHEEPFCRICLEDVETEYGGYRCSKKDCNYLLHANCVKANIDEYHIDPDEIKSLLEDMRVDADPPFTLIEENEFGEAVKIKHFLHDHDQHELKLEDKIEEVEDKQCDGCVDLISAPFYHCLECNFMLHKSCAELPRKCDWLIACALTLKSAGVFYCDDCKHQCSGFSYIFSPDDPSHWCIRCARISDTFEYSENRDILFYFESKAEEKCTACDGAGPSYTSKDKKVAIDFRCVTLPRAARHKYDKHVLKLTYEVETKDPTQHICDICEDEIRDPNHWFYHCSICNNSAHPKCVFGEYPNIKIGSMYKHKIKRWQSRDENIHEHPLTFVKKIYDYPECVKYGQRCEDLSLECATATCNYIVHWKCVASPSTVDGRWPKQLLSDCDV